VKDFPTPKRTVSPEAVRRLVEDGGSFRGEGRLGIAEQKGET